MGKWILYFSEIDYTERDIAEFMPMMAMGLETPMQHTYVEEMRFTLVVG